MKEGEKSKYSVAKHEGGWQKLAEENSGAEGRNQLKALRSINSLANSWRGGEKQYQWQKADAEESRHLETAMAATAAMKSGAASWLSPACRRKIA